MIHPSYFELMELVNKDVKEGEKPVVTSRYSIVLGTAKRARQLVAANKTEYNGHEEKALSIAVDELMQGEYHITRTQAPAEAEAEEEVFDAEETGEAEDFEESFEESSSDEAEGENE